MFLDFLPFVAQYVLGYNPARISATATRRGIDFQPIEPGETDIFTLEFSQDMQNGRSCGQPTFSCSLISTDTGATPDTNPSSRLIGVGNTTYTTNPITGNRRVFCNQRVGNMVSGNLYAINATVQTSDGSTISRYANVYCKTPV